MQPIEFTGRYTSCKVFAESLEPTAEKQIQTFLECPAFEGSKIRIMPDVHAGAGAVIGFTATLTDKIVPNVIGVDIGCGVMSADIGHREVDFPALDAFIRKEIPSGFSVRERSLDLPPDFQEDIIRVSIATEQHAPRVLQSVGTLGGGNHFIELGREKNGRLWLTVHTGSRNFGLRIAEYHQKKATAQRPEWGALAWLEGSDKETYLDHLTTAQWFARENRSRIVYAIAEFLGVNVDFGYITAHSVHNHIDRTAGMIRKGAISAKLGEHLVIPWNMRDGLIIGRGRGNTDWNSSAPHGAGRVMGRGQARRSLKVEDFKASMEGIWSSSVGESTLDESPAVYKPAKEIRDAIADTVDIMRTVKPVYSFKAS